MHDDQTMHDDQGEARDGAARDGAARDGAVGRLRRVPVRDVFAHEAHDFTTWLEDHADTLGGAIGMELADVQREHDAGDFSVDLFAEDGDGRRVIIENQLEATDHKHLGQVMTYLSVLDADVAIWVTADARPEHVSAVSWLNENATGADFYLVKVEGVKVDDSRPAPLFTRIVGPSRETRAAGQRKKELNERDRKREAFFEALLPVSDQHTTRFKSIAPKPRVHISASAGPGYSFGYYAYPHTCRAQLWIHFGATQAVNDAAFEVLQAHRDEIDAAVDADLDWVQDDQRRRLIRCEIDGGFEDEAEWDAIHDRLARAMAQLEAAVEPHLDAARDAADAALDDGR